MRRPPLGFAALLLAAAVLLAMLLPGTATAAAVTNLRLTQLSPDMPNVDVTITSSTGRSYQVDDFGYGNATYQAIDSGTYTVQTRLTSDPTAPPIVIGTLQADQSRVYTAALLRPRAGASLALLTDDLTPPGPGSARMRVAQAAQGAGSVTVTSNGTAMGAPVAFGKATDYVNATAGHGIVGVTPTSGAPFTLPVDLADGGVYTVIVLQRGPSLGGHVLLDAFDNRGGGGGGSGGGGVASGGGGVGANSGGSGACGCREP